MSTLRIEFVTFGSGAGMDNTSSGILKDVISAVEVDVSGAATDGEDLIEVPDKATGLVLIGLDGDTYVYQSKPGESFDDDREATAENSKLVRADAEVGWKTVGGRFISVLERV